LEYLSKFAVAIVMMFTGWKMIAGLTHVTHHGPYAMALAILTRALVYKVGIFEGLVAAMAIHAAIHYLVYTQVDKQPAKVVVSNYLANLKRVRAIS
jgi:hypothetical protein